MLEKLRAFLDSQIEECQGLLGEQRLKFIERESFGACNFALILTEDDEVIQLWEEYKKKFAALREEFEDV